MPDAPLPQYNMLIGAEWCPARDGQRIVVENPAAEQLIATIPAG